LSESAIGSPGTIRTYYTPSQSAGSNSQLGEHQWEVLSSISICLGLLSSKSSRLQLFAHLD
jgi:hypothetical protein